MPSDDQRHKRGCNPKTGTDEECHVMNKKVTDQKGADHSKNGRDGHSKIESGPR